jgi:hypothetical protein
MASLRKRYAAVSAERPDSPPVAATPVAAAEPPPPAAAEATPIQDIAEKPSPSDEAANNAIKARLAEMERAETLQRGPAVQHFERSVEARPPEPASDPMEAAIAALPPRVQTWYRNKPELLTNPELAARVQYCHHVAAREVGQQFTDPYFDRMETLLGFKQQQQPKPSNNGHAAPAAPRNPASAAPARNAPPVRQQQYNGGAVSAPTSREAPSMASGRPASRRVPLNADELQIAQSLGISAEEYQTQKERMARLRAAGAVQ